MTGPRWGFIGYGAHARTNLYPALRILGIPLAAVATRDATRAAAGAAHEGAASSYGDHTQMLRDGGLDGVFVSVGAEDQAAVVSQCLAAGLPVFAEKPLGMTGPEAQAVADRAASRDLLLSVGFMKRYAPAYLQLQSLMPSDLGRITSFDIFFGFNPWTDELRDDSFLRLAGVHLVNLVQALFGEIAEVHGVSASRGADLSLAFALGTAAGAAGTLTLVGSPAWASEHERVQVSGTRGRVCVEDLSRLDFRPAQQSPARPWRELSEVRHTYTPTSTPASGAEADLFRRGFAGELLAFVDAVRHGTPVPTSADDNVATMRLCDRLIAAL